MILRLRNSPSNMPPWFGSKSSTRDVKKKKSFENLFDGAKRRLKQIRQEHRSSSGSPMSLDSAMAGSRSPTTPVKAMSFDGVLPAQLHPLPCAPPGRTDSGKKVLLSCSPSLPLPSPERSPNTEEVTEEDGRVGSESGSTVSSQESMFGNDACSYDGSSDLLFPSLRSSHGDVTEGFEHKGFGITQATLSPRYSSTSPRQDYPQFNSPFISQRVSGSSPRALSGNYTDAIALTRNGIAGNFDSPARSPRRMSSSDQSGTQYRGRISPERSPAPSPRGRSPGPSPRVLSAAVSPLHPRVSGGEQDSPSGWHERGAHPLPLPPSTLPSLSVPTSLPTPSILRSPGRGERPVNLTTGWRKGSLLGSGTFGQVYTGFHSESGQSCAIKEVVIIPDNEKSMESARQLMQEISLLSQMKHTNIVQYYGTELIEDRLYIYLELMSNGSIHKLIQQYGPLSESCIAVYTRQILHGLCYLHGKNTVHRDIKGANILVDKGGLVKLADFGMAKHISAQSFPLSFKGSPYWMAPEVIRNSNGYDFSVDIWSLGCTVLEMATGKPPWSEFEGIAAVFKIGNSKEVPAIPEFLSDEGKMFLRCCLQRDPRKRPTAAQLLEHPFLNDGGVSDIVTSSMQGLSIMENMSHSRTLSQAGATTVSPSTSSQLFPWNAHHNFTVFPPSSSLPQVPHSGSSNPLQNGNGGASLYCNGLLKSSPIHETCARSPRSPKSPTGADGRKHSNMRPEPHWGINQAPDNSPKRNGIQLWNEDILATALGHFSGGVTDEPQRQHLGNMLVGAESRSQHFVQSPRQYGAMPVQPGSPTLLGRAKSHEFHYFTTVNTGLGHKGVHGI